MKRCGSDVNLSPQPSGVKLLEESAKISKIISGLAKRPVAISCPLDKEHMDI